MAKSNKKNLLIGGLLAIVVVMGIAYAAFASNLNITGSSNITSTWDIEIISVTPDKTAGGTSPNYTVAGDISHSIGTDNLSAELQAALISPGDSVTYTIEVQNKGSLDAVLSTLTKTDSDNDYITFNIEGIAEGDGLAAGATKTFTATIAYKNIPGGQQQPSSTTGNFGLSLQYTQGSGNSGGSGGELSPTGNYILNQESLDIGDTIPNDVNVYHTSAEAMEAWVTERYTNYANPFYLKVDLNANDEITAFYLEFVINDTIKAQLKTNRCYGDTSCETAIDNLVNGIYTLDPNNRLDNINIMKTAFNYALQPDVCYGEEGNYMFCGVSGLGGFSGANYDGPYIGDDRDRAYSICRAGSESGRCNH